MFAAIPEINFESLAINGRGNVLKKFIKLVYCGLKISQILGKVAEEYKNQ